MLYQSDLIHNTLLSTQCLKMAIDIYLFYYFDCCLCLDIAMDTFLVYYFDYCLCLEIARDTYLVYYLIVAYVWR